MFRREVQRRSLRMHTICCWIHDRIRLRATAVPTCYHLPQFRPSLHHRFERCPIRANVASVVAAIGLALAPFANAFAVADLQYLRDQLATIPEGGWVQVNKNKFPDAWVTGPDALPDGSYSWPAAVVRAWSSFAWDSNRGNLLLFGGGHANYMGNEMYIWQGSNGLWTRGSVPSRVVPGPSGVNLNYIVDNAAPQSAHTYDNNLFAPINDLFFTFGGSVFQSGGVFTTLTPSGPVRAGPWAWDPRKADPTKVGGTTGSGYNPSTLGGQMWSNQQGRWTGQEPLEYIESNTAYRQENGHDVLYVTGMLNQTGWQSLYRYELGDVRAGQFGKFEKIAGSANAPSLQATGTIDTWHSLYVRTSYHPLFPYDLGVWQLDKASAANQGVDVGVELVQSDGSGFPNNESYGIDFDDQSGKIVMWDGSDRGTVWETAPALDAAGNVQPVWLVTKRPSTSFSQPHGNFGTGVLGKFHYVADLGAFIALDEWDGTDAAVWLYKPYGWRAPSGANSLPQVSITSPKPGASFASPASISIASNATDLDGTVKRVEFYVDQTLAGTSTVSPFGLTSVNIAPGVHSLTAKAFDNLGGSSTSPAVTISADTVVVTTSSNPSAFGASLTLTASVTGNAPTGTVAFSDAGVSIAGCSAVPIVGTGNTRSANCVTSQLALGVHSIGAKYGGDASNVTVASATPLSQVIGNSSATNWLDDSIPAGASIGGSAWNWVSTNPAPYSGKLANQSTLATGIHQQYFYNAAVPLQIAAGDILYAYVYLDPSNPPSEVMLQWNDGTWEHRAYWGTNLIPWGTNGSASRRSMGARPATGQWVRLEVPAAQVGLEGRSINGIAFTLYGGRATWDAAGKSRPVTPWVDDALPAGVSIGGAQFSWVSNNPAPYSGTLSLQSVLTSGFHQNYFVDAATPLQVGVGDLLYAYVYLDPVNPPSELMLQWNDGTWEHRAYWGANLILFGRSGTASRRYMGARPATGQWVRLEVPAAQVGLEGRPVNGIAFSLYGGRVTWDAAGAIAR